MNPKDPSTWLDASECVSAPFDVSSYDGDMQADLSLLRSGALAVLAAFPSYSCELVVLDDWTMYVRITEASSTIAELCPSPNDDGPSSYFIDLGKVTDEIRVQTPDDVVQVLGQARCTS